MEEMHSNDDLYRGHIRFDGTIINNRQEFMNYCKELERAYNEENKGVQMNESKDEQDFIASQQPLGNDFEKILFENLWSLYDD